MEYTGLEMLRDLGDFQKLANNALHSPVFEADPRAMLTTGALFTPVGVGIGELGYRLRRRYLADQERRLTAGAAAALRGGRNTIIQAGLANDVLSGKPGGNQSPYNVSRMEGVQLQNKKYHSQNLKNVRAARCGLSPFKYHLGGGVVGAAVGTVAPLALQGLARWWFGR